MMKNEELRCFEAAYLALLRLPHGVTRARKQSLLCDLRDVIAEAKGADAEAVQNEFEALASLQSPAQELVKPQAFVCIVDGAFHAVCRHEQDAKEAGFATGRRFDLLPLYAHRPTAADDGSLGALSIMLQGEIDRINKSNEEDVKRWKDEFWKQREIVDQIWTMLGNPSYDELAGLTIFDLIASAQKDAARYEVDLKRGYDLYAKKCQDIEPMSFEWYAAERREIDDAAIAQKEKP